ncbi:response regulator transcription factor [Thalassotalea psychrophila]|uniref:Response regulator transcription factor n=1 Tax=Thalassotalea psychrophila TaxID=3065647 RepID=A0ABY9TR07_9GAMM|nr:response regulator transcription factor [Colwelliaceae bacterium SQ149]
MIAEHKLPISNTSVLIVEDDKIVSFTLKRQLEAQGFIVHQAFKGDAVDRMVIRHTPDCILLDIGLPNINGYDVCINLREYYKGPIVFLTGNDTDDAELKGLQIGADDFIAKNRSFKVLLARLLRLLESKHEVQNANKAFYLGAFKFDKHLHLCEFEDEEISLTNDEYELLYFLLINKNTVVTRDKAYQTLKGISYNGLSRGMDVSISRLKAKLVQAGICSDFIKTVRSKGYRLSTQSLTETK